MLLEKLQEKCTGCPDQADAVKMVEGMLNYYNDHPHKCYRCRVMKEVMKEVIMVMLASMKAEKKLMI